MKTNQLLLLVIFSVSAFSSFAQNNRYHDAMQRNIAMLDTAQTAGSFQTIAINFERIAIDEKNNWLPYYYASYALVRSIYALNDPGKVDKVLDKAERFISIADSLHPKSGEIITMKSFITSGRIMVNPMQRGAQYGPVANTLIEEAIKLDPRNPRPYLLKGSAAFYTPEQWGGGKEVAAKYLQIALDKYATYKPADDLAPDWGEERTRKMLAECKE